MATNRWRSSGVDGPRLDSPWAAAKTPKQTRARQIPMTLRIFSPPMQAILQNLFSQCRQSQLHRKVRRSIVFIDDRIDFNDFKAGHAAVVRDDLHGQVGFAITGAAPYWSAYAGSIFRIDPVHVERDMIPRRAASNDAQCFFDDGAHAALVDIAHGVDLNADLVDVFFFARVDVANPDHDCVLR